MIINGTSEIKDYQERPARISQQNLIFQTEGEQNKI